MSVALPPARRSHLYLSSISRMTNNDIVLQGELYNKVIQAVVEASQVDFEEGGVDQKALEVLRQVSGTKS